MFEMTSVRGPMRKPLRSIILTAAVALCTAGVFYSVTYTATTDPSVRPLAAAVAVALLAILILHGLIDADRGAKGLLISVLSLLPKIYSWGNADFQRTAILSTIVLLIGLSAVWLGPLGVRTVSVACDDGVEVAISLRPDRLSCSGAIAKSFWLTPIQRYQTLQIWCFDDRGNRWDGSIPVTGSGRCGARPLDASYVRNGIRDLEIDRETVTGQRMIAGIGRLREALSDGRLPDRRLRDRLLIATWNIRDLGSYDFRLDESYAYIAEVISHFDIVAVQELNDRTALQRILELLGDNYRAEFSFVSPGFVGNRERLGFIYDARKVAFGEISTTIVLGQTGIQHTGTGQPSRPPFLAEFVVNGRRFFVATAHVYFGRQSGEQFESRIDELEGIAEGLDRTIERYFPDHPVILAGDLQVSQHDGREMAALMQSGFTTDPDLAALGTNRAANRPYDQIMIRTASDQELEFGEFGVFRALDYVFREDEWGEYRIDLRRIVGERIFENKDPEEVFRSRLRHYQISDHQLKWAEFRVDW